MKFKRHQIFVDIESGELRVLTHKHTGKNPRHSSGVILPFNGNWFANGPDDLCIYIIEECALRNEFIYVGDL